MIFCLFLRKKGIFCLLAAQNPLPLSGLAAKKIPFLCGFPYLDNLSNIFTGHADFTLHNLYGVSQRVTGQLLDPLLEGGGEEGALAVGADMVADGPNLGLKPHVKHSVSFVQN